jgi:hypothetical protein
MRDWIASTVAMVIVTAIILAIVGAFGYALGYGFGRGFADSAPFALTSAGKMGIIETSREGE